MQAQETAKAIWRARGFELNADVYMHRQALLASLPMTLSEQLPRATCAKMRRVTRKTMANAIHLAPLIAEWRGTRTPALLFGGRRGQLMTLDVFDNDLGNYNFAIIGAPGSGKSVLMNEMAWSYRAIGAKVWMLDLGRSFEKLCRKAERHLHRVPARLEDQSVRVVERVSPMASSRHQRGHRHAAAGHLPRWPRCARPLDEVQLQGHLGDGAQAVQGPRPRPDDHRACATPSRAGPCEELGAEQRPARQGPRVMLNPYARDGEYERFFEGRNNIDFSNDFVVIENEELKRKPDLHAVVNILLLYQITGEMYLTRDRKKVLFIDELKQQLGDIGADDPVKAAVVEEAARRARKYGGSLGTATQSADDYYGSAQMEAAFNCSDWVFLLRQKPESIETARPASGRITMDESKKRLLQSLRTEPGVFSEVLRVLAGGRRRGAQHPRPVQPPAVQQQARGQRAARRTARAGPLHRRGHHRTASPPGAQRMKQVLLGARS